MLLPSVSFQILVGTQVDGRADEDVVQERSEPHDCSFRTVFQTHVSRWDAYPQRNNSRIDKLFVGAQPVTITHIVCMVVIFVITSIVLMAVIILIMSMIVLIVMTVKIVIVVINAIIVMILIFSILIVFIMIIITILLILYGCLPCQFWRKMFLGGICDLPGLWICDQKMIRGRCAHRFCDLKVVR